MNIEDLRDFCLSLPQVEEKMPFDDNILVFSIKNKMFCLTNITNYNSISVKCQPLKAIELREEFPEVTGGFHLNKKHWNSIRIDGNIPDKTLKEWIKDSYNLVVAGLPKKLRE